jgi:hypothetical protein
MKMNGSITNRVGKRCFSTEHVFPLWNFVCYKNIFTHIKLDRFWGYLILVACFTAGTFSSCESYLKETMISDVSSSSFYVLKDQYYGREAGMYLVLLGTDTYAMGATGDYSPLDQYLFDSQSGFMANLWVSLYKAINQCNAVIGRAAESREIEDAVKTEYTAEARFLRALYYFILIRQWGDVHLTLEETGTMSPAGFIRLPNATAKPIRDTTSRACSLRCTNSWIRGVRP